MQVVKLDYFNSNGKWKYEGEFEVHDNIPLHEIWEDVISFKKRGSLPGLQSGKWSGMILVQAPGHVHDHPRIITNIGDEE